MLAGTMLGLGAWMCPDCPLGQAARQQFFHVDLLRNALIAVSPFVVTLGVVSLLVRAVSPRRSKTGVRDATGV